MSGVKLTKQGVRDLNHLPSKPRGVRLEEPPRHQLCCHPVEARQEDRMTSVVFCGICHEVVFDPYA